MQASELFPLIPNDVFSELAAATWRRRVKQNADDKMPTLPTLEDLQISMVERELDDGLEEFKERFAVMSRAAYPIKNVSDWKSPKFLYHLEILKKTFFIRIGSYVKYSVKYPDKQRFFDVAWHLTIATGLGVYHYLWHELHKTQPDLKHPVAALIEAWFKRPPKIAPVRKRNGIAPRFAVVRDIRQDPTIFGQLPDLPGPHDRMTTYLPAFKPHKQRFIAAPVLHLYDKVGGQSQKRGRAAPIDLRLFFELLMAVPLEEREHRRNLDLTLRDLRDWFYPAVERPDGRISSSYQPSKHLHLIQRGIRAVHNLGVEAIPAGDTVPVLWQPVTARAIPTGDLNSRARFEIVLPPGSSHGALVDRQVLRTLGLSSAIKYRAYISLCYFWDYYGQTKNGRRSIRSTRPTVARNAAGLMVDTVGMPILDAKGKPVTRWKQGVPVDRDNRPTILGHAAREINPAALKRYPVLMTKDIFDLCYSTVVGGEMVTANTRLKRLARARDALREMQTDGYIIIVEDAINSAGDRRGWKILPS